MKHNESVVDLFLGQKQFFENYDRALENCMIDEKNWDVHGNGRDYNFLLHVLSPCHVCTRWNTQREDSSLCLVFSSHPYSVLSRRYIVNELQVQIDKRLFEYIMYS